ncbi:MAG TPA: hypothetical protein VK968_04530, partial [Roseimicrobium sp.]|nr:hypothetical protein [Roseimicrobium sp.]
VSAASGLDGAPWNLEPAPCANPDDLPPAPSGYEWASFRLPIAGNVTGFVRLRVASPGQGGE